MDATSCLADARPAFTNYAVDFKEVLDYIFVSSDGSLLVQAVLPFPGEDILAENTGRSRPS